MKRMKKLMALVIAVAMVLAMGVSVFAATQTEALTPADDDNATIAINNPAKGETYSLFKLFDATVGDNGEITYQCTGDIPAGLTDFFSKDANNTVIPAESILEYDDSEPPKVIGTKMTDDLKAALETWAENASPINSAESDGKEALAFTGLPYGYYVVTTTHKPDGEDAKAAITVTSTKPNASIYDKNENEPSVVKKVAKESYSIGDTVEYTATFGTTNYMGEGENSKQVVDYLIKDTLPPYLSDVTVTSITIGGEAAEVQQFDENKSITIPWAEKDNNVSPAKFTSLYKQGAQIVIKYTAKLTSVTNINAMDKNTVSITPIVDDDNGGKEPWNESWKDDEEIATYAAALKKVDQDGNPLPGATFKFKGLKVTGENGIYTVVSYDPSDNAEESDALATDADGKLYILGLASDVKVVVTEFDAPDGYNKELESEELSPQILSKAVWSESGERYFDADGNLVSESVTGGSSQTVTKNLSDLDENALVIVNKKGLELPTTGGMGTTIFYIVGAILVIGGGILLVSRRRMNSN